MIGQRYCQEESNVSNVRELEFSAKSNTPSQPIESFWIEDQKTKKLVNLLEYEQIENVINYDIEENGSRSLVENKKSSKIIIYKLDEAGQQPYIYRVKHIDPCGRVEKNVGLRLARSGCNDIFFFLGKDSLCIIEDEGDKYTKI